MSALTIEQRVHQAVTKVRIQAERERRQYLRGEIDHLPGMTNARTQAAIIAELTKGTP